jgi:glutathione S-transferase
MIVLYHAPYSRSVRVLWLLEELSLPYRLEAVPSAGGPIPFTAPTPRGKVPTLEDGEVVIFESGAIVEYLLDRYGEGRLAPARGTPASAEFLQWLHFSEATAFPPVGMIARHRFALPESERSEAVVADNRRIADATLAVPERVLSERPYLLGDDFSAADIMLGYTVGIAKAIGLLESLPNLDAYLERLRARPAFQKATA